MDGLVRLPFIAADKTEIYVGLLSGHIGPKLWQKLIAIEKVKKLCPKCPYQYKRNPDCHRDKFRRGPHTNASEMKVVLESANRNEAMFKRKYLDRIINITIK